MFLTLVFLLGTIIPGMPSASFNQSVGINTHMNYGDSQWQNYPFVESLLRGEGFHWIRSSLDINATPYVAAFMQKLDDNDKPDAIRSIQIAGADVTTTAQAKALINIWGISYIEGPNEHDLDNAPSWIADDKATMTALQGIKSQYPGIGLVSPSVSMADPAVLGDISSLVQFGNMHPYTSTFIPETKGWGGPVYGQIYGSLPYNIAAAQRSAVGRPVIATESGYCTVPAGGFAPGCVSETTQASYDERSLFVLYFGGAVKDFVTELLDDLETYGIARADGSLKPAAFGLQGIMAISSDAKASTSACSLDATILASVPVTTYVLCKSNGEKDLYYVNAAQLQDPQTLAATPFVPTTATILVPSATGITRLYTQSPDYHWLAAMPPTLSASPYTVPLSERIGVLAINAGPQVTISMLPTP